MGQPLHNSLIIKYLTITPLEEDPRYLQLFREGEPWKKVYKKLFLKGIKALPAHSSEEEFFAAFEKLEEKLGKSYAFALLAKKNMSTCDLKEKLQKAGIGATALAKVIEHCQEKGYVDDKEHLKRLITKEQAKGLGKRAILFKLRQKKGIDSALLSELLQKVEEDPLLLERQMHKCSKGLNLNNPKEKQKLIARLLRRGFSYENISSVVQNS